jgi:hypothetical protein
MNKQLKKQDLPIPTIKIKPEITLLILGLTFLPVFKSGGKLGLNFWQWIYNHMIFSGKPEYVPEEDYNSYFKKD